jgi:acyl-CoA synthetase (NDP forming)/RimJ/RimL family protein N-acetyltransferase
VTEPTPGSEPPPVTEPAPASYPAHWEADVVLADGGTAHLRPIRPDDADGLRAFHSRLSRETIYLRFFSHRPQLSDREVERFTTVDYRDRVALVCTIGGELAAIGRYDRAPGTNEAEVAFVVEDRHQGRGMGSVLLEHLAAAGRERGLHKFVADVLPGNRAMVGVFVDAGYEAKRSFADGVVHLEFPIEETEESLRVMQAREQRAEARSIQRLLTPRSVAVIGAGQDKQSVGRVLLDNILAAGFQGPVYPVHPHHPYVASIRAYPTVLDIPDDVDLAVVATPADTVRDVVHQCTQKGVRGLVVVSSGFAETGPEGAAAQRDLVTDARASGMRVIGPNCLGIINTDTAVALNATLAPVAPGRGNVGFFCQSGALGIAILESVARRGIGLSTFVSAGNRADVSGNDLLQYWQDDAPTEVVLLYLESFGNPRKFGRLARRLARVKPVVAVKSGRSLAGLPPGHAGYAVDLPETAVDALFGQAGVIRVDTLAQLFDVAQVLAYQPLPEGRRVGIVGNSAALAVLAADACETSGLTVTRSVDVGATGTAEEVGSELAAALADDDVDAVVTVFIPPLVTRQHDVGQAIAEAITGTTKPVVATFLAFEGVPEQLRRTGEQGMPARGSVPSYRSPETAVLALARAAAYAEWRRRPGGHLPPLEGVDHAAGRHVVETALARLGGAGPLAADEVAELLAAYGVPLVPDGDGGADGVEAVVAVTEDPSFGALVSLGIGGVATELMGDRAYRAVPLTDVDAADLVRAPRAAPLLFGWHGALLADVAALEDLILRIGRLADHLPEVCGLSLDPVLVAERGVAVRQAAVEVAPPGERFDTGPRRLRPPDEEG